MNETILQRPTHIFGQLSSRQKTNDPALNIFVFFFFLTLALS